MGSSNKSRPKMPREERAKQFMPFDALKGFREALREVEEGREQLEKAKRKEKTEDNFEML